MSLLVRSLLKQVTSQPVRQHLLSARYLCAAKPDFEKLVKNNKVVVFMKGVPDEPRCGFSNAVVQILRMHGVEYDSHDVLTNDDIRQGKSLFGWNRGDHSYRFFLRTLGIKDFSNWPTIPQIFINGEFVGGCDIMLQMHQNGELIEELKKVGINSFLLDQPKEDGGDKAKKWICKMQSHPAQYIELKSSYLELISWMETIDVLVVL
jgi:monothiol glutaredoxin